MGAVQLTWLRTAILAILGLVSILFPNLVPDGARETIADHAVQAVGAVLAVWAIFAASRAQRQKQTEEALQGKRAMPTAPEVPRKL